MHYSILKLHVGSVYNSKCIKEFSPKFRRKIAYKTFGFLLQLQYTNLAISANFFSFKEDKESIKQLHWSFRKQMLAISSRIAFEYFMHLTYMLGTGQDFKTGKSAIKKYQNWLKEPKNPYTYFAISAARAKEYDRVQRSPEVHASTKLARQILLMSANAINNDLYHLNGTLINQWQFILDIINDREPNGWAASGEDTGDAEWYDLWESGDQVKINAEIERMFSTYGEEN